MHEYGHGLYEHQVAPALDRTPLGSGVSLGLHESQSRMWENLVGRGMPFCRLLLPKLQEAFPHQFGSVEVDEFYRAINRVTPSLIRIHADEVTYNMHVILRFELEQDIIDGQGRAPRPAGAVGRQDGRVPRDRGAGRGAGRHAGRALVGRRRSATSRRTRSAT